jgi:uncharacterized membrane protein YsdA (DUF1294 family)
MRRAPQSMSTVGMVVLWLVACNIASFALYGLDKSIAQHRLGRRIPEFTLLLVGALGGWPAALLAQRVFRHKTQKAGFQFLFWLSAIANCALTWVLIQWS